MAASQGRFLVYEYGLPDPSHSIYRKLLMQRYGVEVTNVGCMPVADEWDWQFGFTQSVQRELQFKYGRDVFVECQRDARSQYDAQVKCE